MTFAVLRYTKPFAYVQLLCDRDGNGNKLAWGEEDCIACFQCGPIELKRFLDCGNDIETLREYHCEDIQPCEYESRPIIARRNLRSITTYADLPVWEQFVAAVL